MPNEEFQNIRGRVTPETATEYLRHYSHVPLPFDAELKTAQEVDRQMWWVFKDLGLTVFDLEELYPAIDGLASRPI